MATHSGATGYAIEANPKTFKILEANINLNRFQSFISALNIAAGDIDNVPVEISDSHSDDCNSIVDKSYTIEAKNTFQVNYQGSFLVTCRTLDSLASEYNFPKIIRLLKIDVEGFELMVLKGGSNILRSVEILYFEYWENLSRKYGYNKNHLFSLLDSEGFILFAAPKLNAERKPNWNSMNRIHPNTVFKSNVNIFGINSKLSPQFPFPYSY